MGHLNVPKMHRTHIISRGISDTKRTRSISLISSVVQLRKYKIKIRSLFIATYLCPAIFLQVSRSTWNQVACDTPPRIAYNRLVVRTSAAYHHKVQLRLSYSTWVTTSCIVSSFCISNSSVSIRNDSGSVGSFDKKRASGPKPGERRWSRTTKGANSDRWALLPWKELKDSRGRLTRRRISVRKYNLFVDMITRIVSNNKLLPASGSCNANTFFVFCPLA